jgi:hypothetical protein
MNRSSPRRYSANFKEFSLLNRCDGIVLPEAQAPGHYQTFFEASLTHARDLFNAGGLYKTPTGREMRLELGFVVNTRERNAVCQRVGDKMCCGLYSCLPFHFFEIVSCCMSYTEFLPFLGESTPLRDVRVSLPDTVIFGFAAEHFGDLSDHSGFVESLENHNLKRRRFTLWMMDAMLEFLWNHEIGHALQGHPDYLSDKRGLNAVEEFTSVDLSSELQRERIMLEKQADAFAFTAFFDRDRFERAAGAGSIYGLSRAQVWAVRMLCVVLLYYSWMWSEFRSTTMERFSNVKARNHPSSIVRYELGLRLMKSMAEGSQPTPEFLAPLFGLDPKSVTPTKQPIDTKEFAEGFELMREQVKKMAELHGSFEGLEYFRSHLREAIRIQTEGDVGYYELMGKIMRDYTYR